MQIIYRLLNADIIDPDYSTSFIYNFDPDLQYIETARAEGYKTFLNEQIYRMGFETFNPIYNLGGIYIFLVLLGTQVFVLGSIWIVLKLQKILVKKVATSTPALEGGKLEEVQEASQVSILK